MGTHIPSLHHTLPSGDILKNRSFDLDLAYLLHVLNITCSCLLFSGQRHERKLLKAKYMYIVRYEVLFWKKRNLSLNICTLSLQENQNCNQFSFAYKKGSWHYMGEAYTGCTVSFYIIFFSSNLHHWSALTLGSANIPLNFF